jgi:uncharacterized protein YgiM (DUF1202 family)
LSTIQKAGFRALLSDWRQGRCYAGYIRGSVAFSTFAIEGTQSPSTGGSTATVTNAALVNVRSGPGAEYGISTSLSRGSTVELLGRKTSSSWAKICLAGGGTGWMNTYYPVSATAISSLPTTG